MLFHVSTSFIIVPPLAFRFTLLRSFSKVWIKWGCLTSETKVESIRQFWLLHISHALPVQLREAPSTSPTASASNLWEIMGFLTESWLQMLSPYRSPWDFFPMDFSHLIFHCYLRWLHGLIRNFLFWCISCLMVFEICGDVLLKIISPGFCRLCTIMEYLEPVENRLIFCEEFRRIRDPLEYDRTQT